MSKLQDLINKLPEEFQALATQYGSALVEMTSEELTVWVSNLISGKTCEAHKELIKRMKTSQLIEANKAVSKQMLALNKKNFKAIEFQEQMLKNALSIGLLMLKAKII